MLYLELAQLYEKLEGTSKRLEKTEILQEFLKKLKHEKNKEVVYLLQGRVFPDYDERVIGISTQLAIKALSKATGVSSSEIVKKWKTGGDLGLVAEEIMKKKKQSALFLKKLMIGNVFGNLKKLPELVGKGAVDKKLGLISELFTSASPLETRYIMRTIIGDLRIGVGSGTLRDAIVWACFGKEDKEAYSFVQGAYDRSTDFALIFESACKGKKSLEHIELVPGQPVKVMLAQKVSSIAEGFETVGKPAAFEFKYDGFRLLITKNKNDIKLFTRRLENVTKQFPDVVKYVKENIRGENFIVDSEAAGFDPKTKKYRPFQEISQRIRRKYDIEKLERELPVEINVFDLIYYNGKNLIKEEFEKRRKLLEKIIKVEKWKIRLAKQIITSDEKEAERFYKMAVAEGEEGIMIKNLKAPYKPGARVGYMVKMKPTANEFDLVIVKAGYGTGKRGGWLSSYTVACEKNGKLAEIGKVSTGLKEKTELGVSFEQLSKLLKPLIIGERGREVSVKPKIIVTVTYQNIQRSPTYESGFALRFPRFTALRPDKTEIASLGDIETEYKRQQR
ncbi:DNA ligase [Candidatus Woesearchaeota archaeon CG10_big_fil_rev_8_21_14_0_10_34_12]|nr:MAG: DNA ligase [Candidatus Woesearchaeota archaeon CG10_big_fil_rev_8_21_14_0_10_34_12]